MKPYLWMMIAVSAVASVFYTGFQIGKVADVGNQGLKEIKETRSAVYEILSSPDKSRQLARNWENWVERNTR